MGMEMGIEMGDSCIAKVGAAIKTHIWPRKRASQAGSQPASQVKSFHAFQLLQSAIVYVFS